MIADFRGRKISITGAPSPVGEALRQAFRDRGARCEQMTAAELLARVARDEPPFDAVIVETGDAPLPCPPDFSFADLAQALEGRAWPVWAAVQALLRSAAAPPRYVIAVSEMPPARFIAGGELRAASEAVLETLCRFADRRLAAHGSRMNLLRYRLAAAGSMPGATLAQVADAAVALCSGLLDSMRGQVLTVDRGAGFSDNVFLRLPQPARAIR